MIHYRMVLFAMVFWSAVPFLLPAEALAGNPFAGEPLYMRYCKNCHGAKGRGTMANAPDFSWRGFQNNGLMMGDRDLTMRILRGKNICPSFQGILSEGDVMNVIAHLRTLR
ncbi:MAG: cytochrome c [Magnetococcales bacterium]|nr:cytochrome c [Magnetococcales bacterium]MBF0438818.1 cytochrome c [Magnetococcales bacterium]